MEPKLMRTRAWATKNRVLLVLLSFAACAAAAPTQTIVDLGSLGGTSSVGFNIDSAGVVVGYSQTAAGDIHAVTYNSGGLPLDLNGVASESYAYGVNSAGTVVGVS